MPGDHFDSPVVPSILHLSALLFQEQSALVPFPLLEQVTFEMLRKQM
jgi:hypothetical protein